MRTISKLIGFLFIFVISFAQIFAQQNATGKSAILDIPYIPGGDHKQQLDLYMPDAKNFPSVLFIHGGSLTSGDRKDTPYKQMCQIFTQSGIGCIAMSYPLVPDHKWPAQPEHVASAFDWVKRNIGNYGGDPEKVFVFGHSSGCLLTAVIGSDSKYLAEKGYTQDYIAGLIPMGCRLNDTLKKRTEPPVNYEMYALPDTSGIEEKWLARQQTYQSLEDKNDAVPANHVDENLPPTLILIAEKERFFPPILRDAAEFAGRGLAAGAKEIDIQILENRTHRSAIEKMTTPQDSAIWLIVNFIQNH